jgi:uncharacterized membrane protein
MTVRLYLARSRAFHINILNAANTALSRVILACVCVAIGSAILGFILMQPIMLSFGNAYR